jgi:hypothetical protein
MFRVLIAEESGDLEAFLIGFQNFLGVVHFSFGYPGIVRRGVSLPGHEEAAFSFYISLVGENGFDFIFFLTIDDVRGRFGVVRAMDFCFLIG